MNIQREKMRCLPMGAAAYFGGDSSSTTKNRTENRDQRVVGGDKSVNSSISIGDGGTATLQITDAGQTAKAIDSVSLIADRALALSGDMTLGALSTVDTATQGFQRGITDLFDKSVNEISGAYSESNAAISDAYSNVNETISDAYMTSKAGEQKILVAAGLLVVGMVALFIVKK